MMKDFVKNTVLIKSFDFEKVCFFIKGYLLHNLKLEIMKYIKTM